MAPSNGLFNVIGLRAVYADDDDRLLGPSISPAVDFDGFGMNGIVGHG